MTDAPVVLGGGARTRIGRYGGALRDVDAYALRALTIREALSCGGDDPAAVDEVVIGEAGQGWAGRVQRAPLGSRGRHSRELDRDEDVHFFCYSIDVAVLAKAYSERALELHDAVSYDAPVAGEAEVLA